jgi:hypothetical protein
LVACTDPAQKTDLRPDGPPELLTVLVQDDAAGDLFESATFCKLNDTFRPGLVGTPDGVQHQICPNDLTMGVSELTDANPSNWYVRLEFDELLDPNIEDLVDILDPNTGMPTGLTSGTLKNTQPVTLQCQSVNGNTMVDIPYDGYYSPAGNKLTWPLGPSLVIIPNSPALVATQSECQITLKDKIVDKDGNPVPTDQRGPYKFKIAPIALVTANTSPSDGSMVDPIAAGVDVTFNTPIDVSSWTALVPGVLYDASNTFAFNPDPGNDYTAVESSTEFFVGGDFAASKAYTWTLKQGAKLKDACGKETTFGAPDVKSGTQVGFMTNDLAFNGIKPFDGQMNAKPSDKIQLTFNQYMNPTTLATTAWSLTPAVAGATANYNGALTLIVDGEFKPSTQYTFTLKSGATIDDCPGGEWNGTACSSTKSATFTNSMGDQVVHFTTAALAMTKTAPADNGKVTLNGTTNTVKIDLTFNFDADPTSLTAAMWSISPAAGTWTVANGAAGANVIELKSSAAVAPGDYTFTLKGTAAIKDMETPTASVFTPGSDVVIHFTVAPAPPVTAAPACF